MPSSHGPQAGPERHRGDAVLGQQLDELLGAHLHALRRVSESGVDVGVGRVDAPALGLPDLELVVDELVEHLGAGPHLVVGRRDLEQLAALIDIERDEGEGKYVQVRGTEPRLTNTTIDGVNLPSPEPGVRQIFDSRTAVG